MHTALRQWVKLTLRGCLWAVPLVPAHGVHSCVYAVAHATKVRQRCWHQGVAGEAPLWPHPHVAADVLLGNTTKHDAHYPVVTCGVVADPYAVYAVSWHEGQLGDLPVAACTGYGAPGFV